MSSESLNLKQQLSDHQLNVFNSEIIKHSKSTGLTYVLWFFLGTLGIHKFYMGRAGLGAMYLICGFIGWIMILGQPLASGSAPVFIGAALLGFIFIMLIIDLFTIPRQIRKVYETKELELKSTITPSEPFFLASN